ncbi:S-layer homology domain-containing protein [Paenibacillus tengchongensis]|uniref:S-layer homology domain-containing protein n=1 Tax=Paenibacillus tengchongensis TaxID=2608684 RepID=UPI0016524272|nr:S-layer homology domain-containing protein [Paenibacillus tengchongensis]
MWDNDTYYAENLAFTDTDPSADHIGGAVSFAGAADEQSGDSYAVLFAGEDGFIGDAIGTVTGSGAESYRFNIAPGTVIPDGAIMIAVVLVDQEGSAAPGYTLTEITDRMTLAPNPEQITISNAPGKSDSVTVNGVQAGDIVRLYSYFGDAYGEQTVGGGQSSAFFNGLSLDDVYRLLLVTVTAPGKHESFYTAVEYPYVGTGSGSSGGGGSGSGGGSDGGGGGPAGGGGGGGGGGLSGIVSPSAGNSGKLAVSEITKNTDGSSLAAVKLEDKQLDTELAKWSGKGNTLKVALTEAADVTKVTLTGSQLSKITAKDKNAVLELQGADSGLVIPAGAFGAGAADAGNTNYILNIAPLKGTAAEAARNLLNAQNIRQVGQFYEYTLTKEVAGQAAVEIRNADRYIGHIIKLTQPAQSIHTLAAVMVDAASGAVTPVPAAFTQDGDKVIATIYRKGNSAYTVISGQSGFKDVPEAHFAKSAIDKLSVRTVVKGYSDNTFKPDNSVTRAEAATLLVKTLGIMPASGTSGSFKDVKAGAWYAGSVAAAVEAGLFKGYTDGTFKPDQTITQQEMMAIIYQALLYGGYEKDSSAAQGTQLFDASAGYKAWSSEAVNALLTEGIVKTKDAFPIRADKTTTRAESAELLYRLLSTLKLI